MPTKNTPPGKLPYSNEGQIKIFLDKQKLKQFITCRPALQEMLREFFKPKWKDTNYWHEHIWKYTIC